MENNPINGDAERWQAFRTGDKEALAYLFNTFVGSLYNYGFKFTQDEDLIEDAIQDLFIRLWTTREKLSVPASVRNYLLKAFRHLLFRKLSQSQKIAAYDPELFFLEAALSAEDQHIQTEHQQMETARLQKAMQQLPPRQKEAVYLRFYENASYEDIARIMGTTVKNTYKHVFRALSHLRDTLITILLLCFLKLF
ncbi:RNA polymerase sigma factor [Chitinophaga nivalis]|uniref:Sigma-70 family RNA polymerase sigma factor n=1 Tax=Chitinophaga nivalis TaxID=2991709 RepID=A0ABT3IGI2_9BACT|nr:sigma-70 family RNA polymerase sigma factor [Chitinophaga nivalis]MCW3467287.1 sigma-70 family RNA polymerase sigma factor [Chitinophaga nivalis]MCW3483021.1 sigma-70 family RNA polymerase sigma factor [Chitinophaga nivalis]